MWRVWQRHVGGTRNRQIGRFRHRGDWTQKFRQRWIEDMGGSSNRGRLLEGLEDEEDLARNSWCRWDSLEIISWNLDRSSWQHVNLEQFTIAIAKPHLGLSLELSLQLHRATAAMRIQPPRPDRLVNTPLEHLTFQTPPCHAIPSIQDLLPKLTSSSRRRRNQVPNVPRSPRRSRHELRRQQWSQE